MRDRSNTTILAVDDDPSILSSIAIYFEDSGYNVITAEDGQSGLDRFRADRPHCLLVDIRMPGISGLDVLATVAEESPETPIIMVSSTNTIEDAIVALRRHAWDFVTKPVYDMKVLEHAVERAIEKAELIHENRRNREKVESQTEELRRVNSKLLTEVEDHRQTLAELKESEERLKRHKEELAELNQSLEGRVREQTETLARRLVTDELTGLHNKVKLDGILRQNDPIVLLLIGLDNFAQMNTYYGFEAGDEILKQFADFLALQQPDKSVLFRLTSSEFVLVFFGVSLEEASDFANRLHRLIFNKNFILCSGIMIQGTATIIVAQGRGMETLKQSHLGMMEAKRKGRNRVLVLTEDVEIEERQRTNIIWMNRVRSALREDAIIPYFQPIVDNRNGQVSKYECLSRMLDKGEVISPYLFIEAAKMVGVIHELTQVIIRKSFDAFRDTIFEFSINITEDDLKEGFLVDYMQTLFAEKPLAPERVVFEVLEGISVTDSDRVLEQLTTLKEMGCKIAIDDFGAEQSNFSRLLELNADYVKIDGKFIKNIHADKKSYTITKAITRLAKDIGSHVIAEFVHCEAVHDKINELGIDYSQGYYIGKPKEHI